jgi:hypothetical protein
MIVPCPAVFPDFCAIDVKNRVITQLHVAGIRFDEKTMEAKPVFYPTPPKGAVIIRNGLGPSYGPGKWTNDESGEVFDGPTTALAKLMEEQK